MALTRLRTGGITANAVVAASIAPGAVDITDIADGAITTNKLAANAITSAKIEANAITSLQVAANAVTSVKLAANAVTSVKIEANAVTSVKLAANAVTQTAIASGVAGTGPAFNANSASGTAMTNGVYVKVTFDTERFDTNSNFASSRFTPTVAGYYQINSHLVYLTTSSVGQVVLALYKNGGVETYTNFVTDTTHASSINLSYLISLNGSTDYVEMFLFMSGAGTLSAQGGSQTTFNGFLARAA